MRLIEADTTSFDQLGELFDIRSSVFNSLVPAGLKQGADVDTEFAEEPLTLLQTLKNVDDPLALIFTPYADGCTAQLYLFTTSSSFLIQY